MPIIGTLASVSILFSSLTSSQHCVGWHQSIDSTSLQYKPEWLLNTGVKNSCLDWGNTIISRPSPEQIKPPTKGFHTGLECRGKPMVKEWKRRQTVSEECAPGTYGGHLGIRGEREDPWDFRQETVLRRPICTEKFHLESKHNEQHSV